MPRRSKAARNRHRRRTAAIADWAGLPPELLADIRNNLGFVDHVSFSLVCRAWRGVDKPEAPWLIFPGDFNTQTLVLFSLTTGRVVDTVHTPCPSMYHYYHHTILGSSGGWLVTADGNAQMWLVNPVTGAQHDLPFITASNFPMPQHATPGRVDDERFDLETEPFLRIRFAGDPPEEEEVVWGSVYSLDTSTLKSLFYRKVVLSNDPRPGSYAAMLLLGKEFGAPAFATAEDAVWRLAASPDGVVEDAIHHEGKFYLVTYTGVVEKWERDAGSGKFTSKFVASSRVADHRNYSGWCRKYLAVAPDGRLMVVIKDEEVVKVLVVDEATMRWQETVDIGEAALFVGVNSSLCVSTRVHPEFMPGCVYFTVQIFWQTCEVGVLCLRDGKVEKIEALSVGPKTSTRGPGRSA